MLLLWTELSVECGRTKEEVPQKMVELWGWRPLAHQSGSAGPPECSRATTVPDLGLTSNGLHGSISYKLILTRTGRENSIQVSRVDS